MAERRFFSKKITESDKFLDMPHSTQVLYFHLVMRADEDGFIRNTKSVLRGISGEKEDLYTLEKNGYIKIYSESIVEIIHFKEMNRTAVRQIDRHTKEYKDWRKSVIKRDKSTCQLCGSKEKICVHHKIRYRDCYDDESVLFDENNGICLCQNCHKLVHGGDFVNG